MLKLLTEIIRLSMSCDKCAKDRILADSYPFQSRKGNKDIIIIHKTKKHCCIPHSTFRNTILSFVFFPPNNFYIFVIFVLIQIVAYTNMA